MVKKRYASAQAIKQTRKGFAVSSALGKLRLFRALRKDKAQSGRLYGASLLHVAAAVQFVPFTPDCSM